VKGNIQKGEGEGLELRKERLRDGKWLHLTPYPALPKYDEEILG
jgi:hypothetical protein